MNDVHEEYEEDEGNEEYEEDGGNEEYEEDGGYEEGGGGSGEAAARGFAAFAARRGSRVRGTSWWGNEWAGALEDTWSQEDALKHGRTVARSGTVGPLTVGPGRIAARVHAGEETYTSTIAVPVLAEEQWEELWHKSAGRPGVCEALLAGELPADLLEAAEDARLGLLPGYGELEPDCDCGEFDLPCSHAVALGYQFSWLLDEDPLLLLLVRGREGARALDDLKSVLLLRALTGADETDGEEEDDEEAATGAGGGAGAPGAVAGARGTPAAEVYARPRLPLPALPPQHRPPEPPHDAPGPHTAGIEADPLGRLAADAARRAHGLLGYALGFTDEPQPPLDVWQDTVRIAAEHPHPKLLARLREGVGEGEGTGQGKSEGEGAGPAGRSAELDRAVAAWRTGGPAGLEVLREHWSPSRAETARSRTALTAGWEEDELPAFSVDGNHWTLTGRGLQLRVGRDGRWYPYRAEADIWWPAGPPSPDPAVALAELIGD
ncbi:hypothetical protein [Streptomyces sp. NPDC058657]|uniref:SWIM zinc finger family protein n=1 Tax=unclassified Streptomyces TaxID=2593676 RepID=UPI0036628039